MTISPIAPVVARTLAESEAELNEALVENAELKIMLANMMMDCAEPTE